MRPWGRILRIADTHVELSRFQLSPSIAQNAKDLNCPYYTLFVAHLQEARATKGMSQGNFQISNASFREKRFRQFHILLTKKREILYCAPILRAHKGHAIRLKGGLGGRGTRPGYGPLVGYQPGYGPLVGP